jgi:hypothetical protein
MILTYSYRASFQAWLRGSAREIDVARTRGACEDPCSPQGLECGSGHNSLRSSSGACAWIYLFQALTPECVSNAAN